LIWETTQRLAEDAGAETDAAGEEPAGTEGVGTIAREEAGVEDDARTAGVELFGEDAGATGAELAGEDVGETFGADELDTDGFATPVADVSAMGEE